MILITASLFATLSIVGVLLWTDWINYWYDFWILAVVFIGVALIFIILYFLFFAITGLFLDISKPREKPIKMYERLLKRIAEMVLQLVRVRLMVRGLDKVPQNKKFLLVSNHQSDYDPMVVVWGMRYWQLTYIMKDSLMRVPIMNRWLHGAGHLSIDRSNAREGMKTINEAISRIENDICSISIYPEGTRSKSANVNQFHYGSFKIATKSHCPIAVVAIKDTYRIHKRAFFKSTKIYLDIIEVIEYEQYKDMSTQELSEIVEQKIKDRLEQLSIN